MRGETFEQPYSFANGMQLRNCICLAPLDTRTALFDGEVSEADRYFHRRHASHVGLTIVGSAYVASAGCTVTGSISVAEDKMIAGLTTLAQTIHQQGAKAVIQLVHAGRMTSRAATAGQPVVGPSALAAAHGVVDVPETLTQQQIATIIDDFGAATQRAIQAGFDGVEIHGANSFLLQQFMSPLSNQRTDQYGGSLVNRMTFPLQVVQRVTQVAQAAGRPFLVGYRLSPEEIEDGGLSLADNLVLLRALTHFPLAYLSLSLHHYDQRAVTLANGQPVAELVHRFVSTVPLMIAGEITTAADLQAAASYGASLAAVGRQIMLDPAWPQKLTRPETLTTKADWTPATLGVPQSIFQFL